MSTILADYTTFGIGGRAKRLEEAHDRDKLIKLAPSALVLGRGSNVLVSDDGYDGTVVINRYGKVHRNGSRLFAGSGASITRLARIACECGLSGLEWAIGIPGSIGGAVRMNAGAFGGCIGDVIEYADVLRGGELIRLDRDALGLKYRKSALMPTDVVIDAAFALGADSASAVRHRCDEFGKRRAASQPRGKSAGSIFKNPQGVSIARVIDGLGFKGYRVGGAAVSEEHANIIVNLGGATARDVVSIIDTVKTELECVGVHAEEEIIYIGDFR